MFEIIENKSTNKYFPVCRPGDVELLLEICLRCSQDRPGLCLVPHHVRPGLSPLPGELVSPGAPADLSCVGGGQHHRDQLHQSQHHANTDVGNQHGRHLHLHLLPQHPDAAVLPDLEILSAVIVIGVSDLVLPTALLHLVTAGVRHIPPHHPVPVLEAPLVFLPSTASQCLLHPVPGRFDRVRLRVVTQELEHKSNKTQEGQSPSSYPLQLPAGNYVHLNLVSQLFCAENRENLPNECDAEEDSQQYVHDPERR